MKALKKTLQACFVSGCMLAGSSTANAAVEYLENGSFETGDFTGWTTSIYHASTSVREYSWIAKDGAWIVETQAVFNDDSISQTFADTPGETLTISGWVKSTSTFEGSNVSFSFNGDTLFSLDPVPQQDWTQYTVTAIATGNDTFTVSFRNDKGFHFLDNFSVSAVPEPSTVLLMGAGMLGAGFIKRRKAERTA